MEEKIKSNKSNPFIRDLLLFILALVGYILLRFKQIFLYSWAFVIWLAGSIRDLKNEMVKRLFWGRSSFYRSTFQFSVVLITIIISLGGLSGRLNLFSPQSSKALEFPTEYLGDADYLDESASIQAIVSDVTLTRGFDVQVYIVQKGDTLSSIAEKFGISADTIRWANGVTGDYIKIGQELQILPINGLVHKVKSGDTLEKIAEKYESSVQDIYDLNWLESSVLTVGQELLVPNGRMPQPKPVVVASKPTYTPPANTTYTGGGGSGSFIRPCACGGITNYFSAWHGGVDIAQAGGCTIVAADSGVVTMARWYGRGGLQIMIDHGNGFVTLYAHNASIYVKEGQSVTKGQPISYMGCTGSCTGTHVHFGVQRYGVWVNPLAYVPI